MSIDDYNTTDTSHFGLSTALADEMPPEQANSDQGFLFEGTLRNLLLTLIIGLVVVFFMFVVLP